MRIALVLLLIAVLLVGLLARFHFSREAVRFTGPTHIAQGDGSVFVAVAGEILHLAANGDLVQALTRELTGLRDEPIDLAVTADGRLLLAEQAPAAVRLCIPEPWSCQPLLSPALASIERQFKVLPGRAEGDYLVTDARGDMLWLFRPASDTLTALLPPGTLAGANGLVYGEGENLWVADTDHRRIVELIALPDGAYVTGREHSAVNALTIGRRFYPMLLDRSRDGRLWVAQAAEFSEASSDLVVYDPESGAQSVVALPRGAYATTVAALDDRVLVTDMERFAVYSVDPQTLDVGEFGDDEFRARLAALAGERQRYAKLSNLAVVVMLVLAGLLLLAAVVLTPREKRWTQVVSFDFDNAPAEPPAVNGTYWLAKDPLSMRLVRGAEWLYYLLLGLVILLSLVLAACLWAQAGGHADTFGLIITTRIILILVLALSVPFAMLPLVFTAARALKRSLGTDGRRVYLKLNDGRSLAVEPSQLFYNQRVLLYRQHTMLLRAGQLRQLYQEGEIEQWLAPLLRQATPASEWGVLKHQWKHRDPLLMRPLFSLGLLLAIVLVVTVAGL